MDTNSISLAFTNAVDKAAASTVTVHGRRRSPASGIILQPGLVITANHVLEHDDDLSVAPSADQILQASLLGRDPGRDLAILKIEPAGLVVAQPAPGATKTGQPVLAVGKPENGVVQASFGIVTCVGGAVRTEDGSLLDSYYRSETSPYPGFSGGPLVDLEGCLLGLNTSGFSRGSLITIPTSVLLRVAEQLLAHGKIRRGFLGIRSQPVELSPANRAGLSRSQNTGLLMVGIEDDSPAVRGGLLIGDILVAIAGRPVQTHAELTAALDEASVGKPVEVEILRGGQPLKLSVTVGERP